MKTPMYKRGQYKIKNLKDESIQIRADKTFLLHLHQLSLKQGLSRAEIIRTLVDDEYQKEYPTLLDLLTLDTKDNGKRTK
jgi:hypothetical protein